MKKFLPSLASLALLVGGLVGGGVAAAQSASASGYGCNGTLVSSLSIRGVPGGAEVYVYWDGTNNCAVAVDNSQNASKISITLWECASSSPTSGDWCPGSILQSASDGYSENYSWYAGPVRVNGVGHCVAWKAEVDVPGGAYLDDSRGTVGC